MTLSYIIKLITDNILYYQLYDECLTIESEYNLEDNLIDTIKETDYENLKYIIFNIIKQATNIK